MIWFILFPLSLIVSALCYLTNPFVVLFADNCGELHGFLKLWQTWDDCLDVEWFVKEKVPKLLRYDFDEHYISVRDQPPDLIKYGRTKGAVICINNNWTIKERLQRYLCRVLWLYRNCAYGFAFYVFGRYTRAQDLKIIREGVCYDKTKNILMRPWKAHITPVIWNVMIDIFLGWKIDESTDSMAMIAGRMIFRWR